MVPTASRRVRALCPALLGCLVLSTVSLLVADQRADGIASVREQCIPFTELPRDAIQDCAVSDAAEFGSVEGQTYFYAIYCIIPHRPDPARCGDDSFAARYHSRRGVAIFTADGPEAPARLLFERVSHEVGLRVYEPPELVLTPAGTILYLPIAYDGTGHFNGSEYYLRASGAWESIDAETWLADLREHVPAGLEIWKGVWPDLRTMQATAFLYRRGDGNCCPTGGAIHTTLVVESRRFFIEAVTVEPPATRNR